VNKASNPVLDDLTGRCGTPPPDRALALNCDAPLNDKDGAESRNWREGKPVRVVRSSKGRRISKYAPEEGNRYDGIYKVSVGGGAKRLPTCPVVLGLCDAFMYCNQVSIGDIYVCLQRGVICCYASYMVDKIGCTVYF
jgi:hypothetical protein